MDDRYLVRTDRLSTISVVATARDGQPSYAFHGEGAADRLLHASDLPATLPDDIRALTFGSYTMVVEPARTTLAALAQRECGRRVISIDPNVRPTVVGDMQAGPAPPNGFTARRPSSRPATRISRLDGRTPVDRRRRRLLAELRRPPGGGDRGNERGHGFFTSRPRVGTRSFRRGA